MARWILSRALPRDASEDVLEFLDESFERRLTSSRIGAACWYWGQTASFSARFLVEARRERRAMRAGLSLLDFKLGARMLARSPGLTLVGVLGMSVAIAIAAGAFSILYRFIDPALPIDGGDRVAAVQNWDASVGRPESRSVHDFITWRETFQSIEDVGAFRQVSRNLIEDGVEPETVRVTEMSAAGFRVANARPLIGRVLTDADEQPGAPLVAVIGYDVWRGRYRSAASIAGRTLQFGSSIYTIVGVMPEGFAFPVNDRLWVPFKPDPERFARRMGPDIRVFARLAPGATFESAQAEADALGSRLARELPQTHTHLRPRVLPYTYPFFDINDPSVTWTAHMVQMLVTMLLIVVCVNVAILVYARTSMRQTELAVRAALGASRSRIVMQLFVEGLVLAAVSAATGIALAAVGLRQINLAMAQVYPQMPFWWDFSLTPGTTAYVAGLALLAAAIIGVVPALKATGRDAQAGLKSISAGSGGLRLGRTWTLLIAGQVAFAVGLLPSVAFYAWDSTQRAVAAPGQQASEIVMADLLLNRPDARNADPDFLAHYGTRHAEIARRLEAEPGVTAVTFALARAGGELALFVEAEGVAAPRESVSYAMGAGSAAGHFARYNRIDIAYLDTFGLTLLAGRALTAADTHQAAAGVIVNRSFADTILGGNALGRRVRYVGRSRELHPEYVELGRWYEVVGVVNDAPGKGEPGLNAKVYHAAARGQFYPASLAVRVPGGAPDAFGATLRRMSTAVDADLQLRGVTTQAETMRSEQGLWRTVAAVLAGLTLSVVALAAAGIYAMMSFTVSQRRREIGIRTALGADPRRILAGIFSRAFGQLSAGAIVGIVVAALIDLAFAGEMAEGGGAIFVPLVAAFMMIVGVLAAMGPARRGLRIHPSEVLKQ
ncbi:MAG: ABC transporter permease [Acidobacteriota bacterium]|nr:ABC transporter permease [Acidobacteriota bacterium]